MFGDFPISVFVVRYIRRGQKCCRLFWKEGNARVFSNKVNGTYLSYISEDYAW